MKRCGMVLRSFGMAILFAVTLGFAFVQTARVATLQKKLAVADAIIDLERSANRAAEQSETLSTSLLEAVDNLESVEGKTGKRGTHEDKQP